MGEVGAGTAAVEVLISLVSTTVHMALAVQTDEMMTENPVTVIGVESREAEALGTEGEGVGALEVGGTGVQSGKVVWSDGPKSSSGTGKEKKRITRMRMVTMMWSFDDALLLLNLELDGKSCMLVYEYPFRSFFHYLVMS